MKVSWWSLVAGLVVLLAVTLFTGDTGASELAHFAGRFHPSLVHLPIGILLVALFLEALSRADRFAALAAAVPVVLLLGAWSAILAALAGHFLSLSGGYAADTLAWHQRLGIGVAVVATLAFLLRSRPAEAAPARSPVYVGLLVLLLGGLAVGGHFGGRLTHGDGYLTRHLPDPIRTMAGLPAKDDIGRLVIEDPEAAGVFETLIQPVLNDRCVACHGPDHQRGRLRLDTPEMIREGGGDGEVVVPGRAHDSPLIQRVWLPLHHDEHMPPEGKPQLAVAEAELLRWWIDQGASYDQLLAEAEVPPTVQAILDGLGLDEIKTGIFALEVPPPDAEAVAAVAATGLSVQPLAEDSPFLHVHSTNVVNTLTDAALQTLPGIAPQVAWLDLARTPVTDAGLQVLTGLPHLTRLHLENTGITDAALAHLAGLEYLEYLNLYGTAVTDAGLQHLAGLPRLGALYLWQTDVTEAGVQRLQNSHPALKINLGWTPDAPATDTSEP